MADIRDTEKPNVVSADKSGFGELVTPATGWTTQTPDTDDDTENNQDPYSPTMLGGPDHEDHNSEWINKTPVD